MLKVMLKNMILYASLHPAIKWCGRENSVQDILHVLLGRNFVLRLSMLKPKNLNSPQN